MTYVKRANETVDVLEDKSVFINTLSRHIPVSLPMRLRNDTRGNEEEPCFRFAPVREP